MSCIDQIQRVRVKLLVQTIVKYFKHLKEIGIALQPVKISKSMIHQGINHIASFKFYGFNFQFTGFSF